AKVIDVRDGVECARGMIAGALRVPLCRLVQRASELRGHRVIAYCAHGAQSATAVSVLRRLGVDAVNLAGGFEGWKRAGKTVVAPGGFDADPACHLGLAPAPHAAAL
ncbi:MAG: rhodanese-like domain-containing protein, partial [Phycisphaerae bacterium]|nr:rhodanese-like domain-containing protein [Phycisphaerae bacterium]